jgi:hypothetical protein
VKPRPAKPQPAARGLVVHEEPLEKILGGRKTWELRTTSTRLRGRIALIQSGSGLIVGTCRVVDAVGPLTRQQRLTGWRRAGFPKGKMLPAGSYAWVIADARRLKRPLRYRHPKGAIVWVRLAPGVARLLPRR